MKMLSPILPSAAAICLLLTAACATTPSLTQANGKTEAVRIETDNEARDFIVFTPNGKSQPGGLLLVLHGGMGNPERMRGLGFEALAARDNFLIAYPRGKGNGWNDGRDGAYIGDRSANADDVRFLQAIITKMVAERAVPEGSVFITGVSNGGMMSLRMVCEAADQLAGVSAVIALLPQALAKDCAPGRPVPLQIIVGAEDKLIPFGGGEVAAFGNADRGKVISAQATVDVFARRYACGGDVVVETLDDVDPEDGTRVTRRVFTGCADGAPLEMLVINGGGHRWPGSARDNRSGRFGRLTGVASQDINGAETVWNFFMRAGTPK